MTVFHRVGSPATIWGNGNFMNSWPLLCRVFLLRRSLGTDFLSSFLENNPHILSNESKVPKSSWNKDATSGTRKCTRDWIEFESNPGNFLGLSCSSGGTNTFKLSIPGLLSDEGSAYKKASVCPELTGTYQLLHSYLHELLGLENRIWRETRYPFHKEGGLSGACEDRDTIRSHLGQVLCVLLLCQDSRDCYSNHSCIPGPILFALQFHFLSGNWALPSSDLPELLVFGLYDNSVTTAKSGSQLSNLINRLGNAGSSFATPKKPLTNQWSLWSI